MYNILYTYINFYSIITKLKPNRLYCSKRMRYKSSMMSNKEHVLLVNTV